MRKVVRALAVLAAMSLVGACSQIQKEMNSASTSADQQVAQKRAEMPHYSRSIGTVAIVLPENNWWTPLHLPSPESAIQMLIAQSGCLRPVDRGRAFEIAERERSIASGGELRRGSNIGKGQVTAADYVLTPDIVSSNRNSGGSALAGLLGAFVPGVGGALLGGLQLTDHSADVTVTITDVRSSEQVAMAEGHAEKSDLGFMAAGAGLGVGPGGGGFGGAAVGQYQNTDQGKVILMAYYDAIAKVLPSICGSPTNAAATNVKQSLRVTKAGHLFKEASAKSAIVRTLSPGMQLYPTGIQKGNWYEVDDELGKHGWVAYQIIELAK